MSFLNRPGHRNINLIRPGRINIFKIDQDIELLISYDPDREISFWNIPGHRIINLMRPGRRNTIWNRPGHRNINLMTPGRRNIILK